MMVIKTRPTEKNGLTISGRLAIRLVAAAVFLTASFGVACGGESEPDAGKQETTGSGNARTTQAPRSGPVTETPLRGNAPDIKVYPVEKCELVPGGSVSGGDVVNFLLPIRNVGNVAVDSLVEVSTEGSSSLVGRGVGSVAVPVPDGTASATPATVAIAAITGQEYGHQQRFTIIADPENAIVELDESNNEMTVLVDFPPAPPSGAAALNCESPAP
jgi:hypothetical protein